ncbi:UPF0262 family protein [Pelagibius sp. Alg239-R121]|uniref:UPF0262 family protein n=1 Tax=Pelagibius sp. Alg239-R121 TaxID=2993448 RepID=UPI0024A66670|nr:UPF0262 family protein [Pelagibius sp. Alg239-R121]
MNDGQDTGSGKSIESADQRLVDIVLDERSMVRRNPDVEQERTIAIFDLLEQNFFSPAGDFTGPYRLKLGIAENRLQFAISNEKEEHLRTIELSLMPFRRIVRDYFSVCETYFEAIKVASPAKIEAIDMGRRGLHNDGSDLLRERLAEKIEIDFETARRLFTLICVLHIRG